MLKARKVKGRAFFGTKIIGQENSTKKTSRFFRRFFWFSGALGLIFVLTSALAIVFLANTAYAASSFARPNRDIITGWTGTATPHWDKIDEVTPDDTDLIRTGFSVGVQTEEIGLSAVADPGVDTGHYLRVRAQKDGTCVNTLTYELVQGTTVIASANHPLSGCPGTKTTDTLALTTAQAAQITDYSDLRVRLTADAKYARVFVTWVEFEVPAPVIIPPSGGDITAPSVSIASPTSGQTVSGTISVSANATDNVGVVGVQFQLDGANLGAEDATSPYAVTLNTITLTNATHTLTAVARDAAGNIATASAVTITVSNQFSMQLPPAGGSYIDPITGKTVYRLTDRQLCPAGSQHTYSDTFEHSSYGTIVQCRYDRTNINLWRWLLIAPDHKTVLFNDLTKSANSGNISYNFAELQWFPNQKRILGRNTDKIFEFDPWNGVTKLYAQMPTGCRFDWRLNPQGHVVAHTGNKLTMCIFDPTTGTSATKDVGSIAANPDQTSALFNGKGLFTWNQQPQRAWNPDFSGEIIFDDFHGHLGQFRDASGQWFTVNSKEDRLANGGVGQIGCPGVAWRPEEGIYSASTGKRVLIWGCDQPAGNGQWDRDHWTTANAVNRFASSGNTSIALWDVDWTTGKVSRTELARTHTAGASYWGTPRATANYDLTEVLYTSGMCDGQVLETDGSVKQCPANIELDIDQYVVAVGSSSPPAGGDTIAPSVSITTPTAGSTLSGTTTISVSATDNVGVVGVQFKLDGANLGSEDTTAPYSVSWDTTTATNATHTLSAVARDAAGNQQTSTAVSVTVNNISNISTLAISAVSTSQITKNSAVVFWTTNKLADGQVKYGTSQTNLSSSVATSTLSLTHSLRFTGLKGNTTYYYQTISKAGSEQAQSSVLSFTTSAKPGKVTNLTATAGSVILSWQNPAYDQIQNVVILRRSDRFPQDPVAEPQYAIATLSASGISFTDTNTPTGIMYYYAIFTLDSSGVYSDPAQISFFQATPNTVPIIIGGNSTPSTPGPGTPATTVTPGAGPVPNTQPGSETRIVPIQSQFRIIKYPGNPTVFVLTNGQKRPIPSYQIFQHNYESRPIATVPDTQTYPTGELVHFRSGALLKAPSDPTVYLILDDGSRYAFRSAEEFQRFGLRFDLVQQVSEEELNTYPDATIAQLSYHAANTFVKYPDSPTVYMIENNTKRPIPSAAVFLSYSDFSKVLTIVPSFQYQDGPVLGFAEGSLVKGAAPAVYLIEHGQKRAFSSAEAFLGAGYEFVQVKAVSDSDLTLHEDGEAM